MHGAVLHRSAEASTGAKLEAHACATAACSHRQLLYDRYASLALLPSVVVAMRSRQSFQLEELFVGYGPYGLAHASFGKGEKRALQSHASAAAIREACSNQYKMQRTIYVIHNKPATKQIRTDASSAITV